MHTQDFIQKLVCKLENQLENFAKNPIIKKLSPVSGGYLTQNYAIETESGEKFFLKEYRQENQNEIKAIKKVENYFLEKDLPLIKLKGKSDYFKVEDKFFSSYKFVKALTFDDLNQEAKAKASYEVGKTIGRLHKISPRQNIFNLNQSLASPSLIRFNERAKKIQEIITTKLQFDEIDKLTLQILSIRKNAISKFTNKDLQKFNSLESCIVHGDIHPRNFFYDKTGNIVNIFDWELTKFEPIYNEFTRALEWTCFDGTFEDQNFKNGQKFIQGYLSENQIGKEKIKEFLELYRIKKTFTLRHEAFYYLEGIEALGKFISNDLRTVIFMRDSFEEYLERLFII